MTAVRWAAPNVRPGAPQKRRARRRGPEEQIQRQCVDILRRFVPEPPQGPSWTAVNPVPAKSKAVAGISKAMGLRKGWPDLELVWRGQAVYVEMKKPGEYPDAEQRKVHAGIVANGGAVHVCRSVIEFIDVLREHGIPCPVNHDVYAHAANNPATNR